MNATIRANQIGTPAGTFFSNSGSPYGAALHHPNRMFLGLASGHNGATDGNVIGGSYLQSFVLAGKTIEDWDYYEDQARLASVSNFGIAVTGVSRTSGGGSAIGIVGSAIADAANGFKVWGGYFDILRGIAGAGGGSGIEVNASQLAEPSPANTLVSDFSRKGATPYRANAFGMVRAIRAASGSDETAMKQRSYAADAAFDVIQNGGAFWTGLNFGFDSIMREGMADDRTAPGNTGYGRAISMPHELGLSWFSSTAITFAAGAFIVGQSYIIQTVGTTDFTLIGAASNTPGVAFTATGAGTGTGTANETSSQSEVLRFYSTIDSPTVRQALIFADTGMSYRERNGGGHDLFSVAYRADANAAFHVIAGAVGVPVIIEPLMEGGGNTNLLARGYGTGKFGFGTHVPAADAVSNGYVEIVDSTGAVLKLMTRAG